MTEALSIAVAKVVLVLKARRRELRMSQATVAAQIGTPKCQVQRWESLAVTPSGVSLFRWARVLDMRLIAVPIADKGRRTQPISLETRVALAGLRKATVHRSRRSVRYRLPAYAQKERAA